MNNEVEEEDGIKRRCRHINTNELFKNLNYAKMRIYGSDLCIGHVLYAVKYIAIHHVNGWQTSQETSRAPTANSYVTS